MRLIRRGPWEVVPRKSADYYIVVPGAWSFNCNMKPDWSISKFKALYYAILGVKKRLSPESLNTHYSSVQWDTTRLMFIFQCILGFHSQNIYFKNAVSQRYIPGGEHIFIEITRGFNSDGGQYDVVLILNKILRSSQICTPLV